MKSTRINARRGPMWVPSSADLIAQALSKYGEWSEIEINLLGKFIEEGATVVDGGAYIGTHSAGFLESVGEKGRVIAFEPNPEAFELLMRNLSGHPNFCAINEGLGKEKGELKLAPSSAGNFGATRLFRPDLVNGVASHGLEVSVPVGTVDDLALESLDFIKLDVEGMEADVLKGAENTIRALGPVVFCECNDVRQGSRLLRWGRKHGYDAFAVISAAFNVDNFNSVQENVFGESVEVGILFCRTDSGASARAATLKLAPIRHEDDLVELMLHKPQYYDEVLAFSTLALQDGAQALPTPRALVAESRLESLEREYAIAVSLIDELRAEFRSSESQLASMNAEYERLLEANNDYVKMIQVLEARSQDLAEGQASQYKASEDERCKRELIEEQLAASQARLAATDAALGIAEKLSIDRLEVVETMHVELEKLSALSVERLRAMEALDHAHAEASSLSLSRAAEIEMLTARLESAESASLQQQESTRALEQALQEANALSLERLEAIAVLGGALSEANTLSHKHQESIAVLEGALSEANTLSHKHQESIAVLEGALSEANTLSHKRQESIVVLEGALSEANTLSHKHQESIAVLQQALEEANAVALSRLGKLELSEQQLGEEKSLSQAIYQELESVKAALESETLRSGGLEKRVASLEAGIRQRAEEERVATDHILNRFRILAENAPFIFGGREGVKAWKADFMQELEQLAAKRDGVGQNGSPQGDHTNG